MFGSTHKMVPKNPNGVLYVQLIGRISTTHQNIENIEASFVPLRRLETRTVAIESGAGPERTAGNGVLPQGRPATTLEPTLEGRRRTLPLDLVSTSPSQRHPRPATVRQNDRRTSQRIAELVRSSPLDGTTRSHQLKTQTPPTTSLRIP